MAFSEVENRKTEHITFPLEKLFGYLEAAGFDLSPAHRLDAWKVLAFFGQQNLREPEKLGLFLAPIFVRNGSEQERFYVIFDRFIHEAYDDDLNVDIIPDNKLIKYQDALAKYKNKRTKVLLRLMILMIIVALFGIYLYQKSTKPIEVPVPNYQVYVKKNGIERPVATNKKMMVDDQVDTVITLEIEKLTVGDTVILVNTTKFNQNIDSNSYRFVWRAWGGDRLLDSSTAYRWKKVMLFDKGVEDVDFQIEMTNLKTGEKQEFRSYSVSIFCKNRPSLPSIIIPQKRVERNKKAYFSIDGPPVIGFLYHWKIFGTGEMSDWPKITGPSASVYLKNNGPITAKLTVKDTTQLGYCACDTSVNIQVGEELVHLPFKPLQPDTIQPVATFGYMFYLIMALLAFATVGIWIKWFKRKVPKTPTKDPGISGSLLGHYDKQPYYIPFREIKGVIRTGREQFRFADALRLRQEGQYKAFDIDATMRATLAQGGYPTPIFRYQSKPTDYLFLVDEQLPGNHLVRTFRHLAENLRGQDVHVQLYWHQNDFKRFWNRDQPQGVALEGLRRLYPQHRVIVLGSGRSFVDPFYDHSPRLRSELVASFSNWPERMLLTPVPPCSWNWQEGAMYRYFPIFPADLKGLSDAAIFIEKGLVTDDLPASFWAWQKRQSDARLSQKDTNYRNWRTVSDHEDYLSSWPDLIRWLHALAVTPSPVWETTLAIGRALGISIDHDRLLALAWIPTLQDGEWHPRLRQEFLSKLNPDDERLARLAVQEELEAVRAMTKNSHAAMELETNLVIQQFILNPEDKENRTLVLNMINSGRFSHLQNKELENALQKWRKPQTIEVQKPIAINISYARADQQYLEVLLSRIQPLEEENKVVVWHNIELAPGHGWTQEMENRLLESNIHLLLISPDLLASELFRNSVLPTILKCHESSQAKVIPILLRACDWQSIHDLQLFQFVPTTSDGKVFSIVSNEGSYFEAETETPQSKSFKGMSEFNYFEEDLSFSNGQNWAQVDRAIQMAIDVVLKEKTPPEQDGTSRFKEWLESDQIIQTVRRPFFTPAFWIAVIFSLLLIALLGSAWQFAGTRTLNNWAFGNKEFVPGRDSLLSNGWIKEQWVVDSGLVYHNQGVTVGNVDRRGNAKFEEADSLFAKVKEFWYIDPIYGFLSTNATQPDKTYLIRNQLRNYYNQGVAILNKGDTDNLNEAIYKLNKALLYGSPFDNKSLPVDSILNKDSIRRIRILPYMADPNDSKDAFHALGIAYLYSGLRDSATLCYQQLKDAGYFDSLSLQPNLLTLLGYAQSRIIKIDIDNVQGAGRILGANIQYQIAEVLKQMHVLTISYININGEETLAGIDTLSITQKGLYNNRLLFNFPNNVQNKNEVALIIRLYGDTNRKELLATHSINYNFNNTGQEINDSDGDGIQNDQDGCPNDPLKKEPGTCGCGIPDKDTDGDGLLDCVDDCPNIPGKVEYGGCPSAGDKNDRIRQILNEAGINANGSNFAMIPTKEDSLVISITVPSLQGAIFFKNQQNFNSVEYIASRSKQWISRIEITGRADALQIIQLYYDGEYGDNLSINVFNIDKGVFQTYQIRKGDKLNNEMLAVLRTVKAQESILKSIEKNKKDIMLYIDLCDNIAPECRGVKIDIFYTNN